MGANWTGMGANWFGANWGGGSADAGTPVFAMRADQPLASVNVPPDFGAKFREWEWDPDLLASLILPEFLAARVGGQDWLTAVALPPPTNPITLAMIIELRTLAVTDRPEALGEIVQQHQNFQICWLQLLNISRATHPYTFLLMKLAARVGEFAMIALKRTHPARPRPSQVCPTLYPPVPVPGHAPYPAGHALIATLTSECLIDLVASQANALRELADRVGNNRVIAGLHYREDITAGANAGRKLKPFISACALYGTTLGKAQGEWA
jgi:hypothetical protein